MRLSLWFVHSSCSKFFVLFAGLSRTLDSSCLSSGRIASPPLFLHPLPIFEGEGGVGRNGSPLPLLLASCLHRVTPIAATSDPYSWYPSVHIGALGLLFGGFWAQAIYHPFGAIQSRTGIAPTAHKPRSTWQLDLSSCAPRELPTFRVGPVTAGEWRSTLIGTAFRGTPIGLDSR